LSMTTRALNGSVPGPALAIYPGSRLRVRFENLLETPSGPHLRNNYHYPNRSNLHTHGLHVAPQKPGDDVLTTVVDPGQMWQYEYRLIPDHSPGTYWIHAHAHGSAVLQTGAGVALPLLVLDPPGFLSPQLAAMQDTVLMLQALPKANLEAAAKTAGDRLLKIDHWNAGPELWLVNGAPEPVLETKAGEWRRLRLIGAGVGSWLNLHFGACDVALLAKDGVYIQDFPRFVPRVAVPPGGRADVVVRCAVGRHRVESLEGAATGAKAFKGLVLEISAAGAGGGEELRPWAPATRPRYLQDLRAAQPDCACSTSMGLGGNTRWMEGHLWEGAERYLHRSPQDAVVERRLSGVAKHPYHAHNYPYQLVSSPNVSDNYFKAGDWHDTYLNAEDPHATVRFQTVDVSGPQVVHCHFLGHSDRGMIAVEMVNGSGPSACGCDLLDAAERQPSLPAALASAPEPVLFVGLAVGLFAAMLGMVVAWGARTARAWREDCYRSLDGGPATGGRVQ